MRLTIIPSDSAIYKDNYVFMELDLSSANIPADVHALQWNIDKGWIEYVDDAQVNEPITELPAWANTCVDIWQAAKTAEEEAIAAAEAAEAEAAAENNPPA